MRYITKRQRAERELCVNCLHYFYKRYTSVEQHKMNFKLDKGSIIRYRKEGQARQYTLFSFQVKSSFIIVADLEASNAANASIPSTPAQHIKTTHRINSYAYFLHIDPDLHDFPYENFSERIYLQHVADDTKEAEQELISCVMRDIYDLAQRLKAWQDHTDKEKMLKELKSKHLLEYTENNTCIYCGEEASDTKLFTTETNTTALHMHYAIYVPKNRNKYLYSSTIRHTM